MHKKISLYFFLCLLLQTGCSPNFVQHLSSFEVDSEMVNENAESAAEIEAMIQPYKVQMEEEMNQPIGSLPESISKRRPNSSMGNWFCDILLDASIDLNLFPDVELDFALQNYGGLRLSSIDAGPVTRGTIFELMPFDNELVVIPLTPDKVQQLLDKVAESNGWPISRNLNFSIQDQKAVDIFVHGKPLPAKKMYHVVLPDYVANGGDDCSFLVEMKQIGSGKLIREIVIEYLEKQTAQNLVPQIDPSKRINAKN